MKIGCYLQHTGIRLGWVGLRWIYLAPGHDLLFDGPEHKLELGLLLGLFSINITFSWNP